MFLINRKPVHCHQYLCYSLNFCLNMQYSLSFGLVNVNRKTEMLWNEPCEASKRHSLKFLEFYLKLLSQRKLKQSKKCFEILIVYVLLLQLFLLLKRETCYEITVFLFRGFFQIQVLRLFVAYWDFSYLEKFFGNTSSNNGPFLLLE